MSALLRLYKQAGPFLKAIAVAIAVFSICRLLLILSSYHHPSWDEAVYLGMGKYLYSFGKIGLWESIRPIGLPLLTGLVWRLGLHQVLASQMIVLGSSIICLILIAAIASRSFGDRAALIAVLLCVTSPLFWTGSGNIMTEIPAAALGLAAIYAFISNRYLLAGLGSGLAFIMKFPAAIFGVGLAAAFLIPASGQARGRLQSFALFLLGISAAVIPMLIFDLMMYGGHMSPAEAIISPFARASSHQMNPDQALPAYSDHPFYGWLTNALFYFWKLIAENPLFILTLVSAYLIVHERGQMRRDRSVILICCILLLVYFSAIENKQARFALLMLPLVAILSAGAVDRALPEGRWTRGRKRRPWSTAIVMAILVCGLGYGAIRIYGSMSQAQASEPAIVDDVYRHFEKNGVSGPVLAADPVFSAYSDLRYIPVYDTMRPDSLYVNPWEKGSDARAVVYIENAFPCNHDEKECNIRRRALFEALVDGRDLTENMTYEGVTFLFYGPKRG